MCDCGCGDWDDEEEDEGFDENDNYRKGRDEHGLVIEVQYQDRVVPSRSLGFPDLWTIEQRMDLGIPSFPMERDIWVTNCDGCIAWVLAPLDELGSPTKDLTAGTPTLIHCESCHRSTEWEHSDWQSWDLAHDQQHWENCNWPDEEFVAERAEPIDEHEEYQNLLRFELEWVHGPIGSRSRPFPLWELYKEVLGDDPAAWALNGDNHVGRCYTCCNTIVAPVTELRSPVEDRLEPTVTIIRCQRCHDRVAWENQELDPEQAMQRAATFVKNIGDLMTSVIDDEEMTGEQD